MFINNNVTKQAVENILNQIGDYYTTIGDKVILYPLKIVSGFTNFTESGEMSLQYDTSSFQNDIGVINGNEPIVCYWEGAFVSRNSKLLPPLSQDKVFSAENGRKVETWIMQYSIETVVEDKSINNANYTTVALNRTIRSFSTNWVPTDNEQKYYLYLYLDKKANSPQFLRMIRKEPRYLPSGKLAGCEMEFVNLNLLYSSSGKDVMNFVKMTCPGGNYAFPKEIETDEGTQVTLDLNKINTRGAKDIQLEFTSPYALNTIIIYGRPKDNSKVEAPRRLLLINPHPSVTSSLAVTGSSLNNYYAVFNGKCRYQSFWANWHEKIESSYNYTAKKTYNGGISIDYDQAIATNPFVEESETYSYTSWMNWTFAPAQDLTYNVGENPFCNAELKFLADGSYTPADFLNMNGFIYYSQEALPLEWGESVRWTVSDFGWLGKIVSGFIQIFTFGFNPGWITSGSWVTQKPTNFLLPATTLNIGKTISTENNPLPFDIFDGDNTDFSASGNNSMICGYRFEMTCYFRDTDQTIEGNPRGKGGDGIWDTKYLGQTKWESGEWIYPDDHHAVEWTTNCRAYSTLTANEEYEVDLVCYQGIGKGDCRMTFCSYPNGNADNAISIYETRQQTNAKFKNDFHLWRNIYKMNYSEEMNNDGYIKYPEGVLPPNPKAGDIRIFDAEGIYNEDKGQRTEKFPEYVYSFVDFTINDGLRNNLSEIYETTGENQFITQFYYKLPYQFKTVKVIDLNNYIPPESIDNYDNFTFIFKAKAGHTTDFQKNIKINISDLVDNEWTPFKMCDLKEIIQFNNGDAYPNRQEFFKMSSPPYDPNIYWMSDEFIDRFGCVAPQSPRLFVKLNKTNQQLQLAFDNPTNGFIEGTKVGEVNLSESTPQTTDYTKRLNVTIPKSDVGGKELTFRFKDIRMQESNNMWRIYRMLGRQKEYIDVAPTFTVPFEMTNFTPSLMTIIAQRINGYYLVSLVYLEIKNFTRVSDGDNYVYSFDAVVRESFNPGQPEVHSTFELTALDIEVFKDFYNDTTRRVIAIQRSTVDLPRIPPWQYKNECFFPGYEITDCYLNPSEEYQRKYKEEFNKRIGYNKK